MKIEYVTWRIKNPSEAERNESWINELSRLRGEVLYDNGKRPAFLLPDGQFYDRDEFDTTSVHILAYYGEKMIGAIRLLPVAYPDFDCNTSKILGKDFFTNIVQALFRDKHYMIEVNRLVVHKDYQMHRMGVFLCAVAFTIIDKLNYFSFANGNIDVVERFYLKHLGGILFPKYSGPYYSEFYNDHEIYVLSFDKKLYTPFFLRQMEFMKKIIDFESIELTNILKGRLVLEEDIL